MHTASHDNCAMHVSLPLIINIVSLRATGIINAGVAVANRKPSVMTDRFVDRWQPGMPSVYPPIAMETNTNARERREFE